MADALMRGLPDDLPTFLAKFGTDVQCRAYLTRGLWPEGFRCAGCGHARAYSHHVRLIEECAGRRDAAGRRPAGQARPRCCRQDRGRRRGRERPRQGAWAPARPAAAAGGARRRGHEPRRVPRSQHRQAGRGDHRWLERLPRPAGQRLRPPAHQPRHRLGRRQPAPARDPPRFGLAKRWLLGTHHGAVRPKHLQAYLDEYVFRFNRRTANSIGHRFARLVEQAVLTPPATYRAIVGQTGIA